MEMRRVLDLFLWIATTTCVVLLMYFSLEAAPSMLETFPGADRLLHFVGYFVTTTLLLFAAVGHPWRLPGPLALHQSKLLIGMCGFGAVLEIAQLATTERTPDLLDALVNVSAVGIALGTWWVWRAGRGLGAARP